VVQETTGARSNPGSQATLAGSKVKQEECPPGRELLVSFFLRVDCWSLLVTAGLER